MLELAIGMEGVRGHEAVVGVFKNEQAVHLELADECEKNGIETAIFPCRGKIDIRAVLSLRAFLKERDIGCVHCHGYKADIYGRLATSGLDTLRIATCHNWLDAQSKMKVYGFLDRWFLKGYDKVVAVSEEVKEKVLDGGVNPERVCLVRNGIRLDRFGEAERRQASRERLGIGEEAVVIGTVGRLSEEKGHRTLLRAARTILESHPEVVFLLIGDGPLKEVLEREFDSPAIVFAGVRSDVADLYTSMDIFVLPSLTEGLPMVLLEAMASGLPVVATAVGEVPAVMNGDCGILVEPDDEGSLRRALAALVEAPEERRALGEAGLRRVKEGFGSGRMIDSYLRIYEGKRLNDSH